MHGTGAVTAAIFVGYLSQSVVAHASDYGIEINGDYRVISNGDWAKTNDVFMDEKTVVQAWSVSSSCESPLDCTGQVTSDQGWTASLKFMNSRWIVDREILNWEPCPDGTAATGTQHFVFWGVDPKGSGMNYAKNTDLMGGWDHTAGPSGACGVNKPLVIRLPLRLERLQ